MFAPSPVFQCLTALGENLPNRDGGTLHQRGNLARRVSYVVEIPDGKVPQLLPRFAAHLLRVHAQPPEIGVVEGIGVCRLVLHLGWLLGCWGQDCLP